MTTAPFSHADAKHPESIPDQSYVHKKKGNMEEVRKAQESVDQSVAACDKKIKIKDKQTLTASKVSDRRLLWCP